MNKLESAHGNKQMSLKQTASACSLNARNKDICTCQRRLHISVEFPGASPKHKFDGCASDLHQTMQYDFCDFLCLRGCASVCLNLRRDLKTCPFNSHQIPIIDFAAHMRFSKCSCGCWVQLGKLLPLKVFNGDNLQTPYETQIIQFFVHELHHKIDYVQRWLSRAPRTLCLQCGYI